MFTRPEPCSTLATSKPAPSSRTSTRSVPSSESSIDRGARAVGVLGRVLQRLEAAEVRGRLDLARVAADPGHEHGRRQGRAQRGRPQRVREPVDRRAPPGRCRAPASGPRRWPPRRPRRAGAVWRRARRRRGSASSASSSSSMRSATRRCWAPSCRSRSIRRRSSSAVAWIRARDSLHLVQEAARLRGQPLVVERHQRVRGRGGDERVVVAQPGVVHDRRHGGRRRPRPRSATGPTSRAAARTGGLPRRPIRRRAGRRSRSTGRRTRRRGRRAAAPARRARAAGWRGSASRPPRTAASARGRRGTRTRGPAAPARRPTHPR